MKYKILVGIMITLGFVFNTAQARNKLVDASPYYFQPVRDNAYSYWNKETKCNHYAEKFLYYVHLRNKNAPKEYVEKDINSLRQLYKEYNVKHYNIKPFDFDEILELAENYRGLTGYEKESGAYGNYKECTRSVKRTSQEAQAMKEACEPYYQYIQSAYHYFMNVCRGTKGLDKF